MGFRSNTYRQVVIDERNSNAVLAASAQFGRGYKPRDFSLNPYASFGSMPAYPRELMIPRSEWRDRCEELEKTGQLLSQVLRRKKVDPKNQQQTSSCWANCVIAAMETRRILSGLDHLSLSPASISGPIKGYRDVGGWPAEAALHAERHGVVPSPLWPDTAISARYDNEESRKSRETNKIKLMYDLPNKSFDALFSSLLHQLSSGIGLLWWGHAIEAVDPLCLGRDDFAIRIKNSWGDDWEDGGYGILRESKGTPDDGVIIAAV